MSEPMSPGERICKLSEQDMGGEIHFVSVCPEFDCV